MKKLYVQDVVYDARASRRDPARYSFAHGGKDGHPFPVNKDDYDRSIALLENAIRRAKTGDRDNMEALKKLSSISSACRDVRDVIDIKK